MAVFQEKFEISTSKRTELVDVTKDYAVIKKNNKEESLVFDTVILALGNKVNARDEIIGQLRAVVPESYVIGDSNGKPGALWNATTSAFDAAMAI